MKKKAGEVISGLEWTLKQLRVEDWSFPQGSGNVLAYNRVI